MFVFDLLIIYFNRKFARKSSHAWRRLGEKQDDFGTATGRSAKCACSAKARVAIARALVGKSDGRRLNEDYKREVRVECYKEAKSFACLPCGTKLIQGAEREKRRNK